MRTLCFASNEALELAITSSLIPAEIAAHAADVWRDGGLRLRPQRKLPEGVLDGLAAAGVGGDDRRPPPQARRVATWAEAILPTWVGEPDPLPSRILFAIGGSWLDTAAEMLRLGCDRQQYLLTEQGVLLLVDAAPYYTITRALDGAMRAYASAAEGVWIELGYAHALAVRQRPEGLLLIDRDGLWRCVPMRDWRMVDTLVDLRVKATEALSKKKPSRRLEVPLRLAKSGSCRAPGLWVLSSAGRRPPWEVVEQLLRDLPDDVQRTLSFAVGRGDDGEVVVLRARTGHALAELLIDGEAFAEHPALPNLWLPCDRSLEPPLGAEKLRELLGASPERLVWLRGGPDGVVATALSDDAFEPLDAWVDFLIHRHADALTPWIRGATFDLGVLTIEHPVSTPLPDARTERATSDADAVLAEEVADDPADEPETEADVSAAPPPKAREKRSRRLHSSTATTQNDAELIALEDACLTAEEEGASAAWARLAEAYARLGQHRDAAHAWVRVLWATGDAAVWPRWRRSLGALAKAPGFQKDGRAASAEALVVAVCAIGCGDAAAPEVLAAFANRHLGDLDVRSAWLLACAVAERAGGDVLRLTRTRDALLAQLRYGLSLDRDVPSFVRVRATRLSDPAEVAALGAALEATRDAIEHGERARSTTEAPLDTTLAYALRVLAWGQARLGRRQEADAWREDAAALFDPRDAAHGVLMRMFDARLAHAKGGLAATAALPTELMRELDALDSFTRYKVDRLREASRILEPVERMDAVQAYRRAEADPRGDAFAGLRGADDPAQTSAQIGIIMRRAFDAEAAERGRLFDGAMDFFYVLPISETTTWLKQLATRLDDVEPLHRALLLEEALVLAGHIGHDRLVALLSDRLEQLVGELGDEHSASLAAVLRGTLRTLRRLGLRDRATRLLAAVSRHTKGENGPVAITRLHVAAGLAFLGDGARAREIILSELDALGRELPIKERLDRVRAIADAVSVMPASERPATALRLLDDLPKITDSFSTNSHFCLSLIHFTESVVHAIVPWERDRSGPVAAFLDEDEHLIRQRIHADLRRLS